MLTTASYAERANNKLESAMGNQNSLMAHTKPLQEEAGSTEPRRKLVVGNDSPLYGAMDVVNKVSPGASKKNNKHKEDPPTMKPVQVQQEGKQGQNQLVIPINNGHSVYTTGTTPNAPVSTIACRILCATLVAVTLLIFLGFLITVAVHPSNYSLNPTLQGSPLVMILIGKLNPFWYNTVTATNPNPSSSDMYVGVVNCDDLVYNNETIVSDDYHTRIATKDNQYQQLLYMAQHSYLLKGSQIFITINITSTPSEQHGGNASLLRFHSYTEYSKLSESGTAASTARYDEAIQLNTSMGSLNEVLIDVKDNGFELFGIKTPNGFRAIYNFTIFQIYFNDSSVDYQCYLAGSDTSCEISINNTKSLNSRTCLIGSCESSHSSSDTFHHLNISFYRRYMNWVMTSLIALVVSLFIIFFAIGTYDCMRKKIFPMGKKAVSNPLFQRRRERMP